MYADQVRVAGGGCSAPWSCEDEEAGFNGNSNEAGKVMWVWRAVSLDTGCVVIFRGSDVNSTASGDAYLNCSSRLPRFLIGENKGYVADIMTETGIIS